nr:TonB-dependent receptor [Acinetobacter sp. NIPH 2699]
MDATLLSHLQSQGLKGQYNLQQGFETLLSGTEYRAGKTTHGYVILKQDVKQNTKLKNTSSSTASVVQPINNAEIGHRLPIFKLAKIEIQAQEQQGLNHISRKELDRFAPISTADMLKGQASVQLGDSRNGGALDVNIRGVQGQNRIAVSVDGAQQSLDVYRGYAGMQNRSYVDPLLIGGVNIEKGPSTQAGGAIGGTVAMTTLSANDILQEGKKAGFRLTGTLTDNGKRPVDQSRHNDSSISLSVEPSKNQGDLFSSSARSGSIAAAWTSDKVDLITAYAQRVQGNYYSGKHGRDRYRVYNKYGDEQDSVAKMYGEEEEVLNSSSDTRSLLLKSILRPWKDHNITLSYMNVRSEFGDVMPSDIYRYGIANIYQYPVSSNHINTFSSSYTYKPEENDAIDLQARFWMTDAKTNQLSASFFAPESQIFRSDRAWSPQENKRYGLELSNNSQFDTSWGNWVFSTKGSVQYERLKPQSDVEISLADQQQNKVMRDAERTGYGLSMKLDYYPTDQLHLWAGLNYDRSHTTDFNKKYSPIYENRLLKFVKVDDPNSNENLYMYWFADENGQFVDKTDPRKNNAIVFTNTNNPLDGKHFNEYGKNVETTVEEEQTSRVVTGFSHAKSSNQKSSDGLAPSLGIEYKLVKNTNLYATYTTKHRTPSLLETSLGTHQVMPDGDGLKPEYSKNWEVGVTVDHQNGLITKLNYFNNDIDQFITRYYDPRSWGMMSFSNIDRFRTRGIEFQTKYDQGGFFADLSATSYLKVESCDAKFAKHLRDIADEYTQTRDTPNCTDGSFMGSYLNTQNPPKFSTNLTLGTRLLNQSLSLGSRYSYTSGPMSTLNKPWQTGATTSQMKYESVHLIDLFADYEMSKNVVVNFSMQNLTNRYYLDPLALSYMPAPGRSMSLGLKIKM